MHRSRTALRRRPLLGVRGSSSRAAGPVVAVAVGAVLVVLNAFVVLGPVLGLVGAAASTGPVVDVPVLSSTFGVLLGFGAAAVLLLVSWRGRSTALAWVLAVLAWVVSALGCLWPLFATASAAVDRARDVLPMIVEIIRSFS